LLKINVEPSSALAMAAAVKLIQEKSFSSKKNFLIILSGGNISAEKQKLIWQDDYLAIQ
jgi:threonine dehydratase